MQNDRTGALFRFLRKNWPRRAIIDVKFEKNKIFDGFGSFSLGGRESDPIFFKIRKKRFFPEKLLWRVSGFFASFSRYLRSRAFFWPRAENVRWYGLDTRGKKIKKTETLPNIFFVRARC